MRLLIHKDEQSATTFDELNQSLGLLGSDILLQVVLQGREHKHHIYTLEGSGRQRLLVDDELSTIIGSHTAIVGHHIAKVGATLTLAVREVEQKSLLRLSGQDEKQSDKKRKKSFCFHNRDYFLTL